MFYWLMKYVVIGPVIKAVFRPWMVGRRNIPTEGAAILASNHLSFSDSIFLPLMIDRRMAFLAKSDYFTGKGIKGWATRMFFTATGQLPIDRSGGKASEASLNTGLGVLGRGELLGIYPEGTRSPDGTLYRGRTASPAWRSRPAFRSCPSSWSTPEPSCPSASACRAWGVWAS